MICGLKSFMPIKYLPKEVVRLAPIKLCIITLDNKEPKEHVILALFDRSDPADSAIC